MEKRLKNKTMAALAGAVIASSVVNGNASERQYAPLAVVTEQGRVQYNTDNGYKNLLFHSVIDAKRDGDNFIRTSYVSGSNNLSLSENNRLIAKTEYKILYPLLYDQHVGPYVFTAIQDTRYGHFRNATQFLYVASEKAKAEGNTLAVDEMNLAYNYMRLAEERGSYNAGNVSVNKASAKALANTFIQRSKIGYEIVHRNLGSSNVSTKYSQNSQNPDNKESTGGKLLEIFEVVGAIVGALSIPYVIIDGIVWIFNKCRPNKKPMAEPKGIRPENNGNNNDEEDRRAKWMEDKPEYQLDYNYAIHARLEARKCEVGTCGHPEHRYWPTNNNNNTNESSYVNDIINSSMNNNSDSSSMNNNSDTNSNN